MKPALEKRRFFRHPLKVPIQYREMQATRMDMSSSLDLSLGGLCFYSERFFSKGTLLDVRIPVGGEIFQIHGWVAYCNRNPGVDRYRIGMTFNDAQSAFHAKLAEQMHKILEYRGKRSRELNQEISEEQAADEWIQKYARHFAYLF